MATKDRVHIDQDNWDYAGKSEILPNDRMQQFIILMALGFKAKRKQPLEKGINNEMFFTYRLADLDQNKSLIYALALYDKNKEYFEDKERRRENNLKFVNLEDEKEMYTIAEEYANGGAYYLKELDASTALDEKHLLELEINKYLKKIEKYLEEY